MRLVIIESPYAGDVARNVAYARACLADSLKRGEAPIASHLLYTQPGVLDDNVADERALGIAAGLAWRKVADAAVFYVDFGWSDGMKAALAAYKADGIPHYSRSLNAPGSADLMPVDRNRYVRGQVVEWSLDDARSKAPRRSRVAQSAERFRDVAFGDSAQPKLQPYQEQIIRGLCEHADTFTMRPLYQASEVEVCRDCGEQLGQLRKVGTYAGIDVVVDPAMAPDAVRIVQSDRPEWYVAAAHSVSSRDDGAFATLVGKFARQAGSKVLPAGAIGGARFMPNEQPQKWTREAVASGDREQQRWRCFEPGGMYEHASVVGIFGFGAIDVECPAFDSPDEIPQALDDRQEAACEARCAANRARASHLGLRGYRDANAGLTDAQVIRRDWFGETVA